MLEQRDYTRQELVSIYKTERVDAIKKKLSRQGYTFEPKGRGNNLVISIISLPVGEDAFKRYCVEELGFSPQTSFDKLKVFLYNCLDNEGFIALQHNEMAETMERQGTPITEETVSGYCKAMARLDWFSYSSFDYVYYVFDKEEQHNKYIDQSEYRELYRNYWKTVEDDKSTVRAEVEIRAKYGSKPKKRLRPALNGFYHKQYNTLMKLIREDGE